MNNQDTTNKASMLRIGTVLRGTYRIERYLASGGFGKTYVAYNTEFDELVAIKEFFLKGIAKRDDDQTSVSVSNDDSQQVFSEQMKKFKKEAQRLRLLSKRGNKHIVNVHDLFEENGTAYYVMDYVEGENLRERLERTNTPLTEQEVRQVLPQVLDALKTVHAEGLWHLDLKPGNIMVDKDGTAKLIDFGASKQLNKDKGGATAHTSVTYTNGYAPREQMEQNYEKFGPWTDIYALGATLYALLTNRRPPMPSDLDDDDTDDKHEALPMPPGVSTEMRDLIIWMMNTKRNHRPQSVEEVENYLGISARHEEVNDEEKHGAEYTQAETSGEETEFAQGGSKQEETEFVSSQEKSADETVMGSDADRPRKEQQLQYEKDSGSWTVLGILAIGTLVITCSIIFFRGCGNAAEQPSTVDTVDTVALDEYVDTIGVTYKFGSLGTATYHGDISYETDKPNGQGIAYFDDGRYYEGPFKNGKMEGTKAYFKYPNGDTFEGEFRDNAFYYGIYTVKKSGEYFKGYFKDGQPSKGKWYDKNDNLLGEL